MAQVAFDYYSPAFLFSKAHAEPPGFIGIVQAREPRYCAPMCSYHRRSTIRSFNWPTKSRVPNRRAQGASAAKASQTHRMSRSTRNNARKHLMFSKFFRSKRSEARGEANMWPLLDMSLGHATRVEPIHRSHQC
jgi:hypothetical protein